MSPSRILRHDRLSRMLHWLMAASVLALLATGLLPVVGVEFEWVTIHWIAGLVLTLGLVVHILRVIIQGRLTRIWVGLRDLRAALAAGKPDAPKPGKYSLAQKLMHNAVALFGLAAVGTGIVMLMKIDTPFWTRNPYLMSEQSWGVLYVVHGLTALVFLSLVMLHIYFSLRPEKAMYLRSMLTGWMTREEYLAHHDSGLWPAKESEEGDRT